MRHSIATAVADLESGVAHLKGQVSCMLLKINQVDCAIDIAKSLLASTDRLMGGPQANASSLSDPSCVHLKGELLRLIAVVEEGVRRVLGLTGMLIDDVRQRLLIISRVFCEFDSARGRLNALKTVLDDVESLCVSILARSSVQLLALDALKQNKGALE
ncbi:hypothetical protein NJC38_13700 [Pseudomonas sp. 21LCFQ010]|nr:hypothetical protein [Pseudomonas sp. 21LCFQ010]